MATMSDRRATLLEQLETICRGEAEIDEAKKESAKAFKEDLDVLKARKERILAALSAGADPQELPIYSNDDGEVVEGLTNYEPTISLDESDDLPSVDDVLGD
jgi:hypothetical protein